MQIGPGVHELWSDKQTNKQTNKQTDRQRLQLYMYKYLFKDSYFADFINFINVHEIKSTTDLENYQREFWRKKLGQKQIDRI